MDLSKVFAFLEVEVPIPCGEVEIDFVDLPQIWPAPPAQEEEK